MPTLSEITVESLKDSALGTFKNPGTWILLAILTAVVFFISALFLGMLPIEAPEPLSVLGIILIVIAVVCSLLIIGVIIKPMRGEKPSFSHFGKTFGQGFLITVLLIIYTIVPLLLAAFIIIGVTAWGYLLETETDWFLYLIPLVLCWIAVAMIFILCNLVWLPAGVQFAKTGKLSAGLSLSRLFEMITSITWGKCILGAVCLLLLELVLFGLVILVAYLLLLIPFAGIVLGTVFAALFIPFCFIFRSAFCAKLFEGA